MRSLRWLFLPAVLAAVQPAPVAAQPAAPAAAPSSEAEQLYREGMDFVTKQKWPEAEAKFRRAFELNPTYDTANNLGQAEIKLGKVRDAAEHISFALRNWPVAGKKVYREAAAKSLEELRGQLGAVTVEGSVPGALVSVNGREVGRAPIAYELFVDPGAVTVEAKLDGYQDARQVLTAEKGKKYAVKLAMERAPAAVPSATASASEAPSVIATSTAPAPRSKVPAFVIGGAGVAGLIAGGALLGVGFGQRSDVLAHEPKDANGKPLCYQVPPASGPEAHPECAGYRATAAQGATLANTGAVLLAVGGAAVLASVAYLLWPVSDPAPAGPKPSSRVVPVVDAQTAGLVWTGSF